MKIVVSVLFFLFLALQYKLWVEDGGLPKVWRLKQQVASQHHENNKLKNRNTALMAEVDDLKKGSNALEERARTEMGMIKRDETFFQLIPKS